MSRLEELLTTLHPHHDQHIPVEYFMATIAEVICQELPDHEEVFIESVATDEHKRDSGSTLMIM